MPQSNSPVTNVAGADIRCNAGGARGVAGKCTVAAGATVTVEMHQQPNDRNCKNEAIGGAHYGPVNVYLSKVADAATADGSAPWYKIFSNAWAAKAGAGAGDNDYWGTNDLNACCGRMDVPIPAGTPAGDYLLRAEVIALHTAGSAGGAQCKFCTGGWTRPPPQQSFTQLIYTPCCLRLVLSAHRRRRRRRRRRFRPGRRLASRRLQGQRPRHPRQHPRQDVLVREPRPGRGSGRQGPHPGPRLHGLREDLQDLGPRNGRGGRPPLPTPLGLSGGCCVGGELSMRATARSMLIMGGFRGHSWEVGGRHANHSTLYCSSSFILFLSFYLYAGHAESI